MSRGYVVEHKANKVRYAVSAENYNKDIHTKVRYLLPGESVRSFAPRYKKYVEQLPTIKEEEK